MSCRLLIAIWNVLCIIAWGEVFITQLSAQFGVLAGISFARWPCYLAVGTVVVLAGINSISHPMTPFFFTRTYLNSLDPVFFFMAKIPARCFFVLIQLNA